MLARLLLALALLVSGPALAQQVSAPQPRNILTLPRVLVPSGSDLFLVQRQGLPVGSGTQAMSVDALTAYLNAQIVNAPGIQAIATSIAAQAAAAASTAVQGEATRAIAAEGANAAAISNEITRAIAAEATNAGAVTTERARAQIAEGNNGAAISSETSRATAAEALAFPASSAGTAATKNVGTTLGTVADGSVDPIARAAVPQSTVGQPGGVASYGDSRITGAVQAAGGDASATISTAVGGMASASNAARAGHALNVIDDFHAYGDGRSAGMLVTTTTDASARTVTFAQSGTNIAPGFAAADIGLPIEIGGAGASGGLLTTTITGVLSATQITVADPAQTAQSSTLRAVVVGHDDTIALNNAFAASAKQPVFVPCALPGSGYRITGQLNIPVNGFVYGRIGNPYYYLRGQAGAAGASPAPCQLLIADGYSGAWSGATAGIFLSGYNRLEGIGIDMQSVSSPPPAIYGKTNFMQIVYVFTIGGKYGLQAGYNGSSQDLGWFIWGNDFSTATQSGIRLDNVTDSIVSQNWSHGHAGTALDINSSGGLSVVGNVLENCNVSGILVYGTSQNNSYIANKIVNNLYWGIQYNQVSGDNVFSANMISYNGTAANGANWYFTGTSTGILTSVGNSYRSGGPGNYQANAGTGATLDPASTFIEAWPAQASGTYFGDAQKLIQPKLLLSPNNLPGPYASDAAAASGGVLVGAEYYDTSGVRRKRIS